MKKFLIFALVAALLVPSMAGCSVNTINGQPPNTTTPVPSEQPVPTSSFQAPVKPEDLPIPADDSCILDYANILGDGYSEEADTLIFPWIESINDYFVSHDNVNQAGRLFVVTIPSLGGIDANVFAERLLEYWGTAYSREGHGMLLLLVPEDGQFTFVVDSSTTNELLELLGNDGYNSFVWSLFSSVSRVRFKELYPNNPNKVVLPDTPFSENEHTFLDFFNEEKYVDAVGSFFDNLWVSTMVTVIPNVESPNPVEPTTAPTPIGLAKYPGGDRRSMAWGQETSDGYSVWTSVQIWEPTKLTEDFAHSGHSEYVIGVYDAVGNRDVWAIPFLIRLSNDTAGFGGVKCGVRAGVEASGEYEMQKNGLLAWSKSYPKENKNKPEEYFLATLFISGQEKTEPFVNGMSVTVSEGTTASLCGYIIFVDAVKNPNNTNGAIMEDRTRCVFGISRFILADRPGPSDLMQPIVSFVKDNAGNLVFGKEYGVVVFG